MKKRAKMVRLCFLGLMVFGLAGVLMVSFFQETADLGTIGKYLQEEGQYISFSHEEAFQPNDFDLEIVRDAALPSGAAIYYTLDGNTPTTQSNRYSGPIHIARSGTFSITVIKAMAVWKDACSPIYTKTYLLGDDIAALEGTILVSLSSDEDGLYDYDRGILVYGRPYDEFLQSDQVDTTPPWQIPANFKLLRGREHERQVYVEVFQDAQATLAQQAGLTVSGGASSYYDQKSLKLVARKSYDAANSKFNLNVYGDVYTPYASASQPTRFDKLVLKNGGQDRSRAFIRLNLANRLANDCGLAATSPTTPVVVFLNGAYYSIAQLQPSYSNYYLTHAFNLPDETAIEVFEYSDRTCLEKAGVLDLVYADLSVAENRAKLEEKVDMDALLLYYAFEMCTNNADWPGNNVKMWRYTGDSEPDNPYTDQRLRPLIFDFDKAFMISGQDAFVRLLEPDSDEKILRQLLTCSDYENQFVNICNLLLAGPLHPDHALEIVEQENRAVQAYEENPLLGEDVRTSLSENRQREVQEIQIFLSGRAQAVHTYLERYLGCKDPYVFSIQSSAQEASIRFESCAQPLMDLSDYRGIGYGTHPITLLADVHPGYEFDCWQINGERYTTPEITLSHEMTASGNVQVQLHTRPAQTQRVPVINEISAKDDMDWIELYNPYSEAISLRGLYLSDDAGNLRRYALPEIELEGYGYLLLNCKNNRVYNTYILNFNLKKGEDVWLSDQNGSILDHVKVRGMQVSESYGRHQQGNSFTYFYPPTPGMPNP